MGATAKRKESDLFDPIKQFFEEKGHTVYSEVSAGKRADVVAVHGHCITVCELKTSLSLDLLEQAVYWKGYADYVWMAVPMPKDRQLNAFVWKICHAEGIGLLRVDFNEYGGWYVQVDIRPRMNRNNRGPTKEWLRKNITEHHGDNNIPGGSAGGGYVTPYKITMIGVRKFLESCQRNPYFGESVGADPDGWCTINMIADHCESHYATPKPSISQALVSFESEWCEVKIEKGKRYFRAKMDPAHNPKRG